MGKKGKNNEGKFLTKERKKGLLWVGIAGLSGYLILSAMGVF